MGGNKAVLGADSMLISEETRGSGVAATRGAGNLA